MNYKRKFAGKNLPCKRIEVIFISDKQKHVQPFFDMKFIKIAVRKQIKPI